MNDKPVINDRLEWFDNEMKELKKKRPFFCWYYPKWLAITEWYYRLIKKGVEK